MTRKTYNRNIGSNTIIKGRLGFCSSLTLLFIGLKLTGNIAWSWWWVLSPLWIPALVCVAFAGLVVGVAALTNYD